MVAAGIAAVRRGGGNLAIGGEEGEVANDEYGVGMASHEAIDF